MCSKSNFNNLKNKKHHVQLAPLAILEGKAWHERCRTAETQDATFFSSKNNIL